MLQKKIVMEAMEKFKALGGVRSVVIFDSPIGAMQVRRLARETGVCAYERYLDSQTTPDFEKVGLAWVMDGKDPDLKIA